MGLDMYLSAKKFLWIKNQDDLVAQIDNPLIQDLLDSGLKQGKEPFDTSADFKMDYIEVQAAYWSWANQIHSWFVKNVQDGEDDRRPHYVSRDQLAELKETCEKVLLVPGMAEELLPTRDGFFFGSNTIGDKWYMSNLRITLIQIDKCMKFPDPWEFYYTASW